jgi:hypothetical protein
VADSGPVQDTPRQPGAPYDAADDGDISGWKKVETVPAGGAGHGWDSEFEDGPAPWRQT